MQQQQADTGDAGEFQTIIANRDPYAFTIRYVTLRDVTRDKRRHADGNQLGSKNSTLLHLDASSISF